MMDSYRILQQASFNLLYTSGSYMHTLANSDATLFAKQKGSSGKEMHFYSEIVTCAYSYTMDHSKFIVSKQKK